MLREHAAEGLKIHLFVRRQKRQANGPGRLVYCGEVRFRDWHGDGPITIEWDLPAAVPERLRAELQVPAEGAEETS